MLTVNRMIKNLNLIYKNIVLSHFRPLLRTCAKNMTYQRINVRDWHLPDHATIKQLIQIIRKRIY